MKVYQAVQARLGTQRTVVVQPTAYGTDNRCSVAAVALYQRPTLLTAFLPNYCEGFQRISHSRTGHHKGRLVLLGLADTRGVAIVDQNVTDSTLERLTQGGIRGARFQMLPEGFSRGAR